MSFENFFWAKTSGALFLSFENCRKIAKEAIKARVIDVKITSRVSNYKKFKLDTHMIAHWLRDK